MITKIIKASVSLVAVGTVVRDQLDWIGVARVLAQPILVLCKKPLLASGQRRAKSAARREAFPAFEGIREDLSE
jgi:hypothetical protein